MTATFEAAKRDLAESAVRFGAERIDVQSADLVVLGSGIAGLTAAVTALDEFERRTARDGQPRRVALLTKGRLGQSGSSPWAQGGIAAALGGPADVAEHAEDTLRVGRGLAETPIVRDLVARGADVIEDLEGLGVRFDRDAEGSVLLGREGGHSRRRVLHADGDATGAEIMRGLREHLVARLDASDAAVVVEDFFAEDLITEGHVVGDTDADRSTRVIGVVGTRLEGGVFGARASGDTAPHSAWLAPRVLLATGGMGQLYERTTNPPEVTGDGIAMAARAGALLADVEMIQFHPTTLALPLDRDDSPVEIGPSAQLLTEALRGEGALLVDEHGERFMPAIHELAELAPRDVVARTLFERSSRGEVSYLDLRPVHEQSVAQGATLAGRFPTAWRQARAAGFDPTRDLLPVTPAAHYTMGGVWTDGNGRTSLPGLWAVGEVASSGVHGANRLASNSLLEGAAFGRAFTLRLLEDAAAETSAPAAPVSAWRLGGEPLGSGLEDLVEREAPDPSLRRRVQQRMSQSAGLVRDAVGLEELGRELDILQRFRRRVGGEERNLLLLGRLVSAAALARTETRGAHFRSDHPERDDSQAVRRIATSAELLEGRSTRRQVARRRVASGEAGTGRGAGQER